MPAWLVTYAIPPPMRPAPSMPILCTSRGATFGSSTPESFLSAVVAKKIDRSCRDVSLTTSSPKAFASSLAASENPFFPKVSITSRMRSVAG
jgi:hypothetical protein